MPNSSYYCKFNHWLNEMQLEFVCNILTTIAHFLQNTVVVNRNCCSALTATVQSLQQLKITYCIIYVIFLALKVLQTETNHPVIFHILNIQQSIKTMILKNTVNFK